MEPDSTRCLTNVKVIVLQYKYDKLYSPANRDEVFSFHGDAPGQAFLGLCTHSHSGLHETLLHPTGPLPLRHKCTHNRIQR